MNGKGYFMALRDMVRENVRGVISSLAAREPSQAAFARKVGISPQNVVHWLAGDTVPSLEKMADIAEVYGLPIGTLLEGPAAAPAELMPDEAEVVELMRSMTGAGRAMLVEVARAFKESGSYDAQ